MTEQEWNVADQRELYEVQWRLFASNKSPERRITYSDVPWPGINKSPEDIIRVILYGALVRLSREPGLGTCGAVSRECNLVIMLRALRFHIISKHSCSWFFLDY